jgi:hypothetical protein
MTRMRISKGIVAGLAMTMLSNPVASNAAAIKSVLHFYKVGYFEHVGGIRGCTTALDNLATQYKFTVKHSKDLNDLTNVKNYDLVIYDNNTDAGGVTNTEGAGQLAVKEYMYGGGKMLSIHAASDHRSAWAWYDSALFSGIKFTGHTDGSFSVYKDTTAKFRENTALQGMFKYAKDSLALTDNPAFNTEIYHFNVDPRTKTNTTMFHELRGASASNKVSEGFGWIKQIPNRTDATKPGKFLYTALGHETAEWTANTSWQTKMMYAYMKYLMGDFDIPPSAVKPPQIQTEGHSLRVLGADVRGVQVLDVAGRVVASGKTAGFEQAIPKAGVYFVKVDMDHGNVYSRTITIK